MARTSASRRKPAPEIDLSGARECVGGDDDDDSQASGLASRYPRQAARGSRSSRASRSVSKAKILE